MASLTITCERVTAPRIPDELITVAVIVIGLGWVAVAVVGATIEFLRERRTAQP